MRLSCLLAHAAAFLAFRSVSSHLLDHDLYAKYFTVSRGFKYHYQLTAPNRAAKPYLLFLHGWPSSPYDWRYQIDYFSLGGYGIIAPDMLGYGDTAKPLDAEAYKSSLITRDIVDILDHENIENVIVIGHDWGSLTTSRLANYFQDRFLGFGFIAVGYSAPNFPLYDDFAAQTEAVMGYDEWGYWAFLSQDNATELITSHPDSFWSILYPSDPRLIITEWSPRFALQTWLETDSRTETFLDKEDFEISRDLFLMSGVKPSLNWYKMQTQGIEALDSQTIPIFDYRITKPTFYAGGTRDYICQTSLQKASLFKYASNVTWQDYDSGHWLLVEKPHELNQDLLNWIEGIAIAL